MTVTREDCSDGLSGVLFSEAFREDCAGNHNEETAEEEDEDRPFSPGMG